MQWQMQALSIRITWILSETSTISNPRTQRPAVAILAKTWEQPSHINQDLFASNAEEKGNYAKTRHRHKHQLEQRRGSVN